MAKSRSKIQTNLQYFAVRIIFTIVGIFPLKVSMNFGKLIGRILGTLLGFFVPKLTKTANRNLEIALPELSSDEKAKIIKGCYESLGRQLGLIAHFKRFTAEQVQNLVEIKGRETFERIHTSGRGMLMITGHFGSWEVFNLLPPAFGFPISVLVRRIDNPLVESFVDSLRTTFGSKTIDKTKSARAMFRMLENGEMLGIMADLNAQEREGVFVDFFGVKASTTASIARLALKTNAYVVPVFAVWNEAKQKYVVNIEEPIDFVKSDDNEQDVLELTQKVTNSVEKYVRAFPEQWMWIHKRWNTRPKGEKGFY
jgi:Kdo2-lipid IVA lauroyltransferase/acyltransferase